MTIYTDNDNLITLTNLTNQNTNQFENTATVTYTVTKSGTSIITGSMAYVSGSDGNYIANLEENLSITAGKQYTLTITADNGSGVIGEWVTLLSAETRTL